MGSSGGSGTQREMFASMDAALLAHAAPTAVLINRELRVREIRGDLSKVSVAATLGRVLKGTLADRARALIREGGGAAQERDLRIVVLPVASPEHDPLYCVVIESL